MSIIRLMKCNYVLSFALNGATILKITSDSFTDLESDI